MENERIWYPDEGVLFFVHEQTLQRYGGHQGFERGIKPFKKILSEMRTKGSIFSKAAVLLKRVLEYRMFTDANHRTAYEITDIFLSMNNQSIAYIDEKDRMKFMKNLRSYDLKTIEKWLENGKTR